MGRVLKSEDGCSDWNREFVFTDKDFSVLRKLVNQYTGISLSEAKRELVYCRLSRRLRHLNLKSFKNYCELLQDNKSNDEIIHFTNAITTNLTAFFRESHHFDFLNRHILMPYAKRGNGNQRLRIWSAGCSTGEEPYSIAMTIMDSRIVIDNTNVRILATDVDSSVLATARAGIYPLEKLKSIPPHKTQRWFLKGSKINTGYGQVKPALQEFIRFRELNLMDAWPMRGPFDVIFCRNVVIYFNKETQRELIDRFADLLMDDGFLFLGHSESLFKVSDRFRLVSQTVYQKIK
ncbi:MAG: protein-glutamate O-methyltransferase CheR [Gammaproteobacteria bacterium]|nr:protein-glutamate O-methyltransferase CheR [Gammaproteobacteria bacterium]